MSAWRRRGRDAPASQHRLSAVLLPAVALEHELLRADVGSVALLEVGEETFVGEIDLLRIVPVALRHLESRLTT